MANEKTSAALFFEYTALIVLVVFVASFLFAPPLIWLLYPGYAVAQRMTGDIAAMAIMTVAIDTALYGSVLYALVRHRRRKH